MIYRALPILKINLIELVSQ